MRWMWCVILIVLTGCQEDQPEKKIRETPIGYRGKANLNPYLAAEKYLTNQGWSAEGSRMWSDYGDETAMIFMPGSFLETKGMAMRVLEWVEEGGTLVLTVEGGEPERNDFTDSESGLGLPLEGEYLGLNELFEILEIEMTSRDAETIPEEEMEEEGHLSRPWEVSRTAKEFGGYALEFEGDVTLKMTNGWDWIPKMEGSSRMVGTHYGSGEVIVLAHARPLRNPYLARADHADFLVFLAEGYGDGKLVFLYGSSNSFFGLIWKKGWMVVVAGVIALAFWLWMRVPRFGPVLRDGAVKRRPYGEALTTPARFLWRSGEIRGLLRPLRERLEKENEGTPGTLYDRLAEESGMTRDEVAQALAFDSSKDPGQILKMVQKLQTLLKR